LLWPRCFAARSSLARKVRGTFKDTVSMIEALGYYRSAFIVILGL
jgi:hypothetical protein